MKKKKGTKKNKPGREVTKMAHPTAQEYRDLLKSADDETNRIAARIVELEAGVHAGMTEAEAVEIRDGLQALADELKSVGQVPTPTDP